MGGMNVLRHLGENQIVKCEKSEKRECIFMIFIKC